MSKYRHTAIEQAMGAALAGPAQGAPAQGPAPAIATRILYPALGCPAVIGPRENPASNAPSGAQHRITVLLMSNREQLTPAEVAAHLRLVPWAQRAIRKAPATFVAADIRVRNDAGKEILTRRAYDERGRAVVFGSDRPSDVVAASLSTYVYNFYQRQGLRHLHEITVSEQACARLGNDIYNLFWEVPGRSETAPSAELELLVERWARPRREAEATTDKAKRFLEEHRGFFLDEYRYEYGGIHNMPRGQEQRHFTEVLHPVVVQRPAQALRLAHVTDTHVDTRWDVFEFNLQHPLDRDTPLTWDKTTLRYKGRPVRFNNSNRSFAQLYERAKKNADVIVMTGDLVEYGRGHIGLIKGGSYRRSLADVALYHLDRNHIYFYDLLAGRERYSTPVFTTLGNHDWRLNPYTPSAPGATEPEELIHNYGAFSKDERKEIIALAHGRDHDRWLYPGAYPGPVELVDKWLKFPGSPLETSVQSVAWYLLLINPFLDYAVPLPGGQQLLMLDWGDAEDVSQHTAWALDYGVPSEENVLSTLQRWHVEQFTQTPGVAKVIGKHAPVLGARPVWTNEDLARGNVTYTRPEARALFGDQPIQHHTICAIEPRGKPRQVAAIYASMMRDRDWLIRRLAVPTSGVRLVLAGHVHRHNLLVAYPSKGSDGWLMKAVADDSAPGYSRSKSPLYVNTQACGMNSPRFTDARHPGGEHVAPGFNLLTLSGNGAIGRVRPQQIKEPNMLPPAKAPARPVMQPA